jgi:hypothetical protein
MEILMLVLTVIGTIGTVISTMDVSRGRTYQGDGVVDTFISR